MTGKFSIKRRKQDTPRPSGQSSQRSILAALGIGVGRSSPHTGSKPGYAHLTDPAPALRQAAAQEWSAATGRPIPPHLRARQPLQPPAAFDVHDRAVSYGLRPAGRGAQALLEDPSLTPAQRRRLLRKAGGHGQRPAGWSPQRTRPGPRAPRTPAQRARAAKNARQQARHQARLP